LASKEEARVKKLKRPEKLELIKKQISLIGECRKP
jgi:predicted GIY-YIG superfamily endonuclease